MADDATKLAAAVDRILGMDIRGHTVKSLLIEEAADIAAEYYASFTLDRSTGQYLGMLSAKGGVEIEEVAATDPEAIARLSIDPVDGLDENAARSWVRDARLDREACSGAVGVVMALYRAFVEGRRRPGGRSTR